MVTRKATPQERIARDLLTQRPLFLGVDGASATHYWDGYEQAVVVIQDDEVAKVKLTDTPFLTLSGWTEYTHEERGWTVGPYVGGSIVNDLVSALEAST
ncbi:hypothetical protein [Haloarcula sediminis]|uniref:hypothetical protein n=1 Tax=Haloarcula sediminis TaxID=3111777 RepID=UPI002D7830EF|nr:hypothetical protein [Haloarcula sp. CK38]